MFKKNKRGALELSIGTVVIIVIAMSMLILGLVLVRTIFSSATGNIKSIDRGVKSEIQKLFSEDDRKQLVLIPDEGIIELKQGESGSGFALSIRDTHTGQGTGTYSYDVAVADPQISQKCGGGDPIGQNGWARIDVGKSVSGIALNYGNSMDEPIHVRFSVSENAPICTFRLSVTVRDTTAGELYKQQFMDVKIIPK